MSYSPFSSIEFFSSRFWFCLIHIFCWRCFSFFLSLFISFIPSAVYYSINYLLDKIWVCVHELQNHFMNDITDVIKLVELAIEVSNKNNIMKLTLFILPKKSALARLWRVSTFELSLLSKEFTFMAPTAITKINSMQGTVIIALNCNEICKKNNRKKIMLNEFDRKQTLGRAIIIQNKNL